MKNLSEQARCHAKEYGFLLLEALLAITIVTLATVAIMRTYTNSLSAGVLSQQYLTASNLAEKIIWETVSASKIESLSAISNQKFESPNSDYSWSRTIEAQFPEFDSAEGFEDFEDASPDNQGNSDEQTMYILYIIKISVTWQYRRHTHELKYQTAVLRKQPASDMEELDEPQS